MAEVIAAIGGVAACCQLAKYGAGLARLMLNSASERSIPTTVQELYEHLEWHLSLVRSFSPSNHASSASLQPIVTRSIRSALALQQLLKPLIAGQNDTAAKKLRKILFYRKRIRKIAKFQADLENCEKRYRVHWHRAAYRESHPDIGRTMSASTLQGSIETSETSFVLPPRSEFIGREDKLSLVSQVLVQSGNKACLVGLGGIGKSEIAKECAYRIHDQYENISVFWIQASDWFALQKSINQISWDRKDLDLPADEMATIRKLVDDLERTENVRWVLIIDNLDLATDGDQYFQRLASIPLKNGSMLFTTRNMRIATCLAHERFIFTLDPVTHSEASRLLKLQLDGTVQSGEDVTQLLQYLEYLPLAIKQASDFMKTHHTSPAQYLDLFKQQEERHSGLLTQTTRKLCNSDNVITTEILSIVSVHGLYQQDEYAAQLLVLMACLGPAKIPLALFNALHSSEQIRVALEILRKSSYIKKGGDETVIIPRLVRLSVRYFLRQHGISSLYALRVLQLVAESFPDNDKQYSMLERCGLYLPHALAILDEYAKAPQLYHRIVVYDQNLYDQLHINPDGIAFYGAVSAQCTTPHDFTAPLALRASNFLRIVGSYNSAMNLANQASQWTSAPTGTSASPIENLICKANSATLLHYLGHPAVFSNQMNQIFLAQTTLLKAHRPLTVRVLRGKGLALQAQGHHAEAEGYHRRAIAICQSEYGAGDTKLLDEEHGLALCFLGQNRVDEALVSLRTIYKAMKETVGLSNPKTLSVLANIGCALQLLSRWTEAYEAISTALSGRKQVLGADHPHTLQSRANLAQIHVAKGDLASAEALTRETLRLHEAKVGKNHHLSLHILNNLGYLLLGQERYAEAADTLHRVARKRGVVLGSEHCDTLSSMFYACEAYWKAGRLEEAIQLGNKVLTLRRNLDVDDAGKRKEIEERMVEIDRDWRAYRRSES